MSASRRIFISYSHDSDEHKQRVLELAQTLRAKGGLEVQIDRFVEHEGPNWPVWTDHQVENADFVLIVCTAELNRAVKLDAPPETRKGVRWEVWHVFQWIYSDGAHNRRFLPVLLDGATEADIPVALRGTFYRPLESTPAFETLCRRIEAKPLVVPAPLGPPLDLPPQPTILTELPDADMEEQARRYLQRLREDTGEINPGWIDLHTTQATSFPIGQVYVPLKRQVAGEGREMGGPAPDPSLEAALHQPHVVIQGDAGSGKSTFIRCAAFDLTHPGAGATPLSLEVRDFPLYARVAELDSHITKTFEQRPFPAGAPTLRTDSRWLAHFLAESYKVATRDFFERKLTRSDTTLLLDGLDEAPSEENREFMAKLLANAARDYPKCRIVATTRPGGLSGGGRPAGFEVTTIAPFDDEAIERFVASWYGCKYAKEPEKAERERGRLSASLEMPEIKELARKPLMLAALTVIHFNGGRLPDSRYELYETILQWLARARRDVAGGVKPEERLRRLRHLAWAMQTAEGGRAKTLDMSDATEILTPVLGREAARNCVMRDEADGGILVRRGPTVEFAHLTFQEFLAMKKLADMDDIYGEIRPTERLHSVEWREVIRFLAADQSKRGEGSGRRFFNAVMKCPATSVAERARRVALVALLRPDLPDLAECEAANAMLDDYTRQMTALFDDPAAGAGLDAKTRAAAAEAWERLGDRSRLRFPKDPDYWVDLGKFRVGRYPVTVAEYAEFMEAGGAEPWNWAEQAQWPYRPVVGITWHDAVKYCDWAGVRLQSSEEWEFAASAGREKRKYPWGDTEPDGEKANFDNNVGRVTPVGLFPAGNARGGIADLAGHVWEWTVSDYDKNSNKVLRGGAFSIYTVALRASSRDFNDPGFRYDFIGFRCVSSLAAGN